jgi:putative transposase
MFVINTREIAEEYRLSHWAGIMRERLESGLSIKAFCRERGFHQNRYFYWQRKLREAACAELLPTVTGSGEMTKTPHGWAVCELEKPTGAGNGITIEIGKSKVNANTETDLGLLASVCRMLTSIC